MMALELADRGSGRGKKIMRVLHMGFTLRVVPLHFQHVLQLFGIPGAAHPMIRQTTDAFAQVKFD